MSDAPPRLLLNMAEMAAEGWRLRDGEVEVLAKWAMERDAEAERLRARLDAATQALREIRDLPHGERYEPVCAICAAVTRALAVAAGDRETT